MVPVQVMLVMCSGINVIIDGAFASNFIGPDSMAGTLASSATHISMVMWKVTLIMSTI